MSKGGVVVTGVSSGIGAAIMEGLVAAGFRVFGTVRRARDAGNVQSSGAVPVIADVTFRSSVIRAQETVARALGDQPLVGLVNNAGITGVGPIELLDLEELRRTFEVNVFGVVSVTQAFLPMLRASRGRIINLSSVSAKLALPFAGPYGASKSALEAISDSLRRELFGSGVEVTIIQPGSVRTAIWEKIATLGPDPFKDTIYEKPLERAHRMAAKSGAEGLPPQTVARAVLRVLTVPKPPTRMLVVGRGGLVRRLLASLPDRWLDRMIAKRFGD